MYCRTKSYGICILLTRSLFVALDSLHVDMFLLTHTVLGTDEIGRTATYVDGGRYHTCVLLDNEAVKVKARSETHGAAADALAVCLLLALV